MFDRVYVVTVRRRAQLVEELLASWPSVLPPARLILGRDGLVDDPPESFHGSPGSWGCQQSHYTALRVASAAPVGTNALILEDDVVFADDFETRLGEFLDEVPSWQVLMLGGEHKADPYSVSTHVQRCTATYRTHAYALTQEIAADLVTWVAGWNWPLDMLTAKYFGQLQTYAPVPWLCGQRAGASDCTPGEVAERWWANA